MSDRIFLAASYDLKIHAYSFTDGSAVADYEVPGSQVNRIIVSNNRFYVAGYTSLLAYDASGKSLKPLLSILAHESNVTDICVSPTTLFTCGEDKIIKTWDRRTKQVQQMITTTESLTSMLLLNNGYETIVGNESGEITIWDSRNSSSPYKVSNNKSPVRSLSMNPNSTSPQTFIASHMDGSTIRYKIEGNSISELYKIQAHDDIQTRCIHSPDGSLFVTTSADNSAKVWLTENGELKYHFLEESKLEWIWDAAFTRDGKKLCTGGSDGMCCVWDMETGKMILKTAPLEKCVTAVAVIP